MVTGGVGVVVAGALTVGIVVNQRQSDPVSATTLAPNSLSTPEVPDARPKKPGLQISALSDPAEGDGTLNLGTGRDENVSAKVIGDRIVASTESGALDLSTTPLAKPDVGKTPALSKEAPRFDLVRVDPKGGAIVAGKAAPGALVEILVDGKPVTSVKADRKGAFVAMFDMPVGAEAHVIALLATGAAGDKIPSSDQVVVIGAEITRDPQIATTIDPATDPAADPETSETTAETVVVETPEVAPTIIVAGDQGVKLLQPSGLEKADPNTSADVTLDVITYDREGEVVLSGRSEPEKHVRVYVDDAPIKTQKVEEDGSWQLSLPEVAAGRYKLRVDEIDGAGKVTSRVETPFQKEEATEVRNKVASSQPVTSAPSPEPIRKVTVQPGTTLWALAAEKYGSGERYVQIFNANRDTIKDPDLIYPGQIFDIPE